MTQTTQQTATTFDPPPLFDTKGKFVGWPVDVIDNAPPVIAEAYASVRENANELANVEAEIADIEANLRERVGQLRTVESEIARAPKLTQQDLLRACQETQRRYG